MDAESAPVILVGDLGDDAASLFHPFTTTLIELRLSREPLPLEKVSKVLEFVWDSLAASSDWRLREVHRTSHTRSKKCTDTPEMQENRLSVFANVFKGYMGIMPIVTAAWRLCSPHST